MTAGAFPLNEMLGAACPIGRTFAEAHKTCIGHRCPLLREASMLCDGPWQEAVKRHAVEIDDKSPTRHRAAAAVTANPEKHGLVRRFYCGLGGPV